MRNGVRIGVDVGKVRVGVASCDPYGILASPVETLQRDEDQDSDVDALVALTSELSAIEIVVGLPRQLSGIQGESARYARRYAENVAIRLRSIPVRLFDERLSTVSAHQALRASGKKTKKHKTVIDQVAAVNILQAALEAERETGQPVGELISQPEET